MNPYIHETIHKHIIEKKKSSLRIKKQCSFLDDDLTKEWKLLAEFCTAKWIKLIIQQRERKLEKAQQVVQDNEKVVKTFQSSCLFSNWWEVLGRNIQTHEDDLVSNKTKKLEQDILDYKLGRIFEWKRPRPVKVHDTSVPVKPSSSNIKQKNKRSRNRKKNGNNNNNNKKTGYQIKPICTQNDPVENLESNVTALTSQAITPEAISLTSQNQPISSTSIEDVSFSPVNRPEGMAPSVDNISISIPTFNRYSPLSRDLEGYIREGGRPKLFEISKKDLNGPLKACIPSPDNSGFQSLTPKGGTKEKRKLDVDVDQDNASRLNKKERLDRMEPLEP